MSGTPALDEAPLPLFGAAWASRWAAELAASELYRRAAERWEGALVLRVLGEPGAPAVALWADLWHGSCRAARPALAGDDERAVFVLEAPRAVWQRLLAGTLDPLWAVLSGKLRVTRGSVAALVPWAVAARELVAAARRVPTTMAGPAIESTAVPPAAPTTVRSAVPPVVAAPAPALAASPASASALLPPRVYQTTSTRGLDQGSFPMRLWQKAKRRGVWNPADLDFAPDRAQWQALSRSERDVLLRLSALFLAGEESVTLDLLPLVQVIAREGRLEEELFLTSFLFEEAKHVEFFRRFFDEVTGEEAARDLSHYHSPSYRTIFYDALPRAMARLAHDASPVAQAEASVTYNLIVEGVLAETGYHAMFTMLRDRGLLPATQQGVALLKSDESRHLAYGVWLLSRLVAAHGEPVWAAIEERMEALLPAALGVVEEAFTAYLPTGEVPFGLDLGEFLRYATRQFEARLLRIGHAREGVVVEDMGEEASAG